MDQKGDQLTQRTHSQLSQISIRIEESNIVAGHATLADIRIPLTLKKGQGRKVKIWGDEVDAWSYSPVADDWFSKVVGTTCQLVFMPENSQRATGKEKADISFADGAPFLIVGERSLADLNERLQSPIPMNRFRPNIVISGGHPYMEDQWETFQIGTISFHGGRPCIRCVFTTIDQETGMKGAEPLRTLSTYRKDENGVIFGQNAIASNTGTLRVGDIIRLNT